MRYREDVRLREEEPRIRLWQRAARQRGYFTAAQALADGYSYPLQHFHAQRGNWVRVDRGIYRFREFTDLPAEPHDHLVRWTLWSSVPAVISHATALGVHNLGISNPAEIHLTVPPGFRKRDPSVVLHRANLSADDTEDREGFRVTRPLRAVAESAADGAGEDVIRTAVSTLLARGGVSEPDIAEAARRLGYRSALAIKRVLHMEQ